MNQKTFLQIDEPCNQNWNEMSAVEQGRFCASCCKAVTDFSLMSDKEILQILSKATGNSCGRFTKDQLQRPMYQEIPQHSTPYKFFLSAIIPTFLIAHSAMSQKQTTDKTKAHIENIVMGKPARVIECKVGEPGDTVITSMSENKNDKRKLNEGASTTSDKMMMGGITMYEKIKSMDTVKTIVRKAFNQNGFRILGNPASKGNNINLQFKNEGKYMVQFIDVLGKLVYTTTTTTSVKKGTGLILLPDNFIPGTYFIKITDAQKKSFTDKVNLY